MSSSAAPARAGIEHLEYRVERLSDVQLREQLGLQTHAPELGESTGGDDPPRVRDVETSAYDL